MADDKISVELIAKIDQLNAGLDEGVEKVHHSVDQMRDDLGRFAAATQESTDQARNALGQFVKSTEEHAKKEEDLLGQLGEASKRAGEELRKGFKDVKEILHIEEFKLAIEGIKLLFEGLKEGFEGTVGAAEKFGLSTAKFAAIMNTSQADAAGLMASLRGVGVESSAYESIALRLEQRLQTGTGINKDLAASLKGTNGEVLTGQALMERLKDVLTQYNEEGQNAIVVQLGLGRKASDLYDAFRVTSESIEHQKDLYRAMGVDIDGTAEASQRLEEAENDLKTEVEALGIKIGQELMPYAQEALTWMGQNGVAFLRNLAEAFSELAKIVFTTVAAIVKDIGALGETMGRLKHPEHFMEWLNALDDVTGNGTGGPINDAAAQLEGLSVSTDATSSAVSHLSDAWSGLMGAMAGGAPTKEKIFGVGSESLLDIGEGQSPDTNPIAEAIAKNKNPYKIGTGSKKAPKPPSHGAKEDHTPEQDIAAAAKASEAELAIEDSKNAHLFAMGKESLDQRIAAETDYENRKHAIQLEALQAEMALPGRTKAEYDKTHNEIQQLEIAHQAALVKIEQEGETQRAAEARKAVQVYLQAEDERLKAGVADLQELAASGKITALQRDDAERNLTVQIRGEEIARLDAELATLTQGTLQYDAVAKQKQKLEIQLTQELRAENAKRRADLEANIRPTVNVMTSSFFTAFNDMALHGKSFGESMRAMFDSMVQGFVQMAEQMAEKWIITQLVNEAVSQSADAAMATSQATSAATGAAAAHAARSVAAVAAVESNAAIAASAAYAAYIGIPFAGPALAAGAAGAALAYEQAFLPMASAAGGMVLDRDQLVSAHAKEMILPADISQGLQHMIAMGQTGGMSMHVDYSPTIHGGQGQDLAAMLAADKSTLIAVLTQAARDGAFTRRI